LQLDPVRLHEVEFAAIDVTPRTTWVFARIMGSDGAVAEVEITGGGPVEDIVRRTAEAVTTLDGASIADEADVPRALGVDDGALQADMAAATVVSALRTAVLIMQAQKRGISLAEALGGGPPRDVALYANINRGLLAPERTPSDFARLAERAVTEGFRAVKCAPFDEVTPGCGTAEAMRLARAGINRVAAVRQSIGSDVSLMVDCHSRFDVESAVAVAGKLAELGVAWFEEPVDPSRDPAGLAQIAGLVPMPLAGGEHGYGEDFFTGLTREATIGIVMPDVKFCGGAGVAARAGRAAIAAGRGVSLHCPSGPISLLTSGHVTAAVPGAMRLEHAVYEADWRASLLVPSEPVADGHLHLTSAPGLGAELDWGLFQRAGRVWRAS
jgi:galactonate dehydratase